MVQLSSEGDWRLSVDVPVKAFNDVLEARRILIALTVNIEATNTAADDAETQEANTRSCDSLHSVHLTSERE
jgi:hypothetical protein